jgi:hypothetical protein
MMHATVHTVQVRTLQESRPQGGRNRPQGKAAHERARKVCPPPKHSFANFVACSGDSQHPCAAGRFELLKTRWKERAHLTGDDVLSHAFPHHRACLRFCFFVLTSVCPCPLSMEHMSPGHARGNPPPSLQRVAATPREIQCKNIIIPLPFFLSFFSTFRATDLMMAWFPSFRWPRPALRQVRIHDSPRQQSCWGCCLDRKPS